MEQIELAITDSPTRDLAAARSAFSSGDAEASRAAHEQPGVPTATEVHAKGGEFVKSLVFGGLDGIITTFAIVAASEGGDLSQNTVLLMGFANLVADAISMGLGDFISERAEAEYVATEQRREKWEMENYPEGEIAEMVELYVKRGMSKEDAVTVITTTAKYKDIFVENMMVDELGLLPHTEDDDPYEAHKKGAVTFGAFVAFGSVPLIVYLALSSVEWNSDKPITFIIASIATAITMFLLGAAKARFTKQNMIKSGLWMLLNGACAACAAYLIGLLLDHVLDVGGCR